VVTVWPLGVCPGLVAAARCRLVRGGVDSIGAAALSRCGIVAAVSGCDVAAAAPYLPALPVVMW